jgi:hypothetical protein
MIIMMTVMMNSHLDVEASLPPRKHPEYPISRSLGEPRSPFVKRNFFVPAGNEPAVAHSAASRFTDVYP